MWVNEGRTRSRLPAGRARRPRLAPGISRRPLCTLAGNRLALGVKRRERRPDAVGPIARKASGRGPTRTGVLGAPPAAKPDKARGPTPSARMTMGGGPSSALCRPDSPKGAGRKRRRERRAHEGPARCAARMAEKRANRQTNRKWLFETVATRPGPSAEGAWAACLVAVATAHSWKCTRGHVGSASKPASGGTPRVMILRSPRCSPMRQAGTRPSRPFLYLRRKRPRLTPEPFRSLVDGKGLEPSTSALRTRRSPKLS